MKNPPKKPMPLIPLTKPTDPRVKVERAEQHINQLHAVLESFRQSKPYEILRHVDTNTGEAVYSLRIRSDIPTPDAHWLIGDALHNLRSSLDHMVFCLLWAANAPGHTRNTGFPIAQAAGEYTARKMRRIQGVSQAAVDLMDKTKPYKGGNNALWQLHELNIIDKHRLLVTVAGARFRRVHDLTAMHLLFGWLPIIRDIPKGLVKDGSELLRVPANQVVDVQKEFTFHVTINEPGIVDCRPVALVMRYLLSAVRNTINSFEPLYINSIQFGPGKAMPSHTNALAPDIPTAK